MRLRGRVFTWETERSLVLPFTRDRMISYHRDRL